MFKLHLRHKNLLFLGLGAGAAVWLGGNAEFGRTINNLGSLGALGYLGALIGGMMFSSTFTVVTGGLILLTLAKTMPPVFLIIFGVLGAITTDFLIFHFVKDDVVSEITPIYDKVTGSHLKKILHTRFFAWTLPVLGALIIASPLPDELGVSLLGFEQISGRKFLLVSFISHSVGMISLVGLGRIL